MCANPLGQCLAHRRNLVTMAFSECPNRKTGSPLSSETEGDTSICLKRKENLQSMGRKVRDASLAICLIVSQLHETGNLGILDLCVSVCAHVGVVA